MSSGELLSSEILSDLVGCYNQVKVEGAKPFLVSRSIFFIALVRFSRCDTDQKPQIFDWNIVLKVLLSPVAKNIVSGCSQPSRFPICDTSFTFEDYNTVRAYPWSPFSLRRAYPGPGPNTMRLSPTGVPSSQEMLNPQRLP